AREILAGVSTAITESEWEVEVQGHTDNVPISNGLLYPSNWHLGAARAVSVVQYLQEISDAIPQRFMATSFGEYRPVADNNSPEGRRQNRRVEIYLRDTKIVDESIQNDPEVDFVTIENEILEL
ncbi:MAG: OmpA family protein, partial [Balneolales bacterium]|nr:OmpA family protein [Balneolales bacterium]